MRDQKNAFGNSAAQNRYYGIDLLKILSMLMIVTLHILGHGGVLDATKSPINIFLADQFNAFAFCGVNCFAIASGFLMCDRKIKYAKLVPLWITVFFYNFISVVINSLFFNSEPKPSLISIFLSIFPVTSNTYWYFTAYFLLYAFMPFLNIFINSASEKQLKTFIGVGFILISVLNFLTYNKDMFNVKGGYSAWWLMYLYIFGATFKKFDLLKNIKASYALIAYLIIVFVNGTFYFITDLTIAFLYTSPIVIAQSLLFSLFCLRVKIPRFLHKPLTILSPFVFQVYLIHDNPLVRKLVIKNKFISFASMNPFVMALLIILTVVAIFTACILIDQIRYRLFKLLKIKENTDRVISLITVKITRINSARMNKTI